MKTTKRIVAGVLSLTLVLGSFALPASESGITLFDTAITADASIYNSGDYSYMILDDGTIEVISYSGKGGDVTIPAKIDGKKVTKLGDVFYARNDITSITVPYGVKSISSGIFAHCSSITSINVDQKNSTYSSVDGVLFSKDKTKLIMFPHGKAKCSYTVPNSTKIIGDHSFSNCKKISNVIIPDSVSKIEESAFAGSSVKKVNIPSSVSVISAHTFYGCTNLESFTIPDGVTTIEDEAFENCDRLREIKIPDSVTSFGNKVFETVVFWHDVFECEVTIRCNSGSAAEQYAKENGIYYECIDSDAVTVGKVKKNGFSCTSNAIRINWHKLNNASGYRIYRQNPTTKKWEKIKTLSGGDTLTYRMSGLDPNTEYKYKVKAYMKSGGNTYWGVASEIFYTMTKPSSVTITKTSKSTTAVRLYWDGVKCDYYSIDMYNAEQKTWEFIGLPDSSVTNYRISGLKKNKSYKFKICPCSKFYGQDLYPEYYSAWTYVTVRTKA